jgi:hypothetical protein
VRRPLGLASEAALQGSDRLASQAMIFCGYSDCYLDLCAFASLREISVFGLRVALGETNFDVL